jgi:deoxyribonuclease-4
MVPVHATHVKGAAVTAPGVTADPPVVDIDPASARFGLMGRLAGPHLPTGDGLVHAAERAQVLGATAIQVFTADPRAWADLSAPGLDVDRFRARLDAADIQLLVHASYLVNLASPDPEVHRRGIERMRREMAVAASFGARAVTMHVGSHRGAGIATGVGLVADALARILEPTMGTGGPRLVLEVSAGQGDSLGTSVEELGAIVRAAARRGIDQARLGVCLDTAHLWAAGHAVDDPTAIDALLAEVDAAMGAEALAVVHLNDSRAARGSRQDRHEHLGDGRIGAQGLAHLVRHPRLARVPMLLETPDLDSGWDAVDMARLRAWLGDERVGERAREVTDAVHGPRPHGARTHIPGSAPEPA